MEIAELTVLIEGREVIIKNCSDDDGDVEALLDAATCSRAVIRIEVPRSADVTSALGRLNYGRPKLVELIEELSTPVTDLNISTRLKNVLGAAGIDHVCQLVQMSESEVRGIKNLGSRSFWDLHDALKGMGLGFGMDLSRVRGYLPCLSEEG